MDDRVDSLVRRVERLEQSNFILKLVNVGVVAAVAAMVQLPSIMAVPSLKNVIAQRFDLVTSSGVKMASLAPNPGGGSALTFYDAAGKPTVEVASTSTGAGMSVFDGNALAAGTGIARAGFGLGSASSQTPGFGASVVDPNGKLRLSLGTALDASTGSSFLLYDENAALRNGLDVNDVNPSATFNGLFIDDVNGTSRFFITAADGDGVLMRLNDANGVEGFSAGVNASEAAFGVADAQGRTEIGVGGGRLRTGSGPLDCPSISDPRECFGISMFDIQGNIRNQLFDSNDESFGYQILTAGEVNQVLLTTGAGGGTMQTFGPTGTQTGHVP